MQSHASQCNIRDFEEYRGFERVKGVIWGPSLPTWSSICRNCRCNCDHLGYGNYQVRQLSKVCKRNLLLAVGPFSAMRLFGLILIFRIKLVGQLNVNQEEFFFSC